VLVIQGNAFNRSRISTVVIVPVTSNLRRADDPGNVLLSSEMTGLPQDSVANSSLVAAIDRGMLDELVGQISERLLQRVLSPGGSKRSESSKLIIICLDNDGARPQATAARG
jgi:mRNA interferase MazF